MSSGKYISNSEIMDLFKLVDEVKASDMSQEQIDSEVKKIHNKIVTEMSFLVYHFAKPYTRFPNYEDLVQEGFVGLIRAVNKFEWPRFPNFFVYSERWILNGIKRAASKFDVVYNPNRERTVYAEPHELGLEEESGVTPEEEFFTQEKRDVIVKVLAELPDRDREIVQRIFGIGDFQPQTLREIGPLYNLTHERIRQIKNNVITKLRKHSELAELS